MAHVAPLRGWRVTADHAARVAAVPYDVVSRNEAVALAADNPFSYLHVTKPEIDVPATAPPEKVYAQGAAALHRLIMEGVLVREAQPCYYAYGLTMGRHRQVGVVLAAAVADYESNIVRKHEHTRPDKENDRVRHMEALGAQTGKVFVVHRPHAEIAAVLEAATAAPPSIDFTAADGVRHTLWIIDNLTHQQRLTQAFAQVGPLYIADGHHRAAAAARVAVTRRAMGRVRGTSSSDRLLAVSFASDSVQILPYHRVVRDLAGLSVKQFVAEVSQRFEVRPGLVALQRHQFGMWLDGDWHTLTVRADDIPGDIVGQLDVSLLQERLLNPVLKIADPRRDDRIDFVGGIHGIDGLMLRAQQSGYAVAFALHPTSLNELLAVADAGTVMPPKSTWFEPKLRDGLITLRFDAET